MSAGTGARRSPRQRTHRRTAVAAALAVSALGLTACGGSEGGGSKTLTWYINNASQAPLAATCVEQSGGAYNIDIQLLPNAASGQREQLLRRLAAGDKSVDIMSLDPPFMAEFANAKYLRPFTDAERSEFSQGVLKGPADQAIFEDQMFSAPFYGNTQLLWYKKSVAQKAGLDPARNPVTWQQLIDGAIATGTTIGAQGRRNESLMVWVNALVESGGGSILAEDSQDKPEDEVEPTINSDAGRTAADIMSKLANSPAAFDGFSTAGEEESRAAFQAPTGGFMVNWPYVWSAWDSAIEAGTVPANFKDDVAWARYPRVLPGTESATPLGGIGISISAFSRNQDLAVEAVRCLRDPEQQKTYMLSAGDPGASASLYDDPEIREKFPMADAIREGLTDAAPRPISPYYGDVTSAIQRGYHPPNTLNPATTPEQTASLLKGVLTNQQLL